MSGQRNAGRLEEALAFLSRGYATPERLAAELGLDEEAAASTFKLACGIRRCMGRPLVPGDAENLTGAGPLSGGWYVRTDRLDLLLEQFMANEALAAHYCKILRYPEGGHFALSLASDEIARIVGEEYRIADHEGLKAVAVGATPPRNDVERVVANAGKLLLDVVSFRDEPITPAFLENLYARLTAGVCMAAPEPREAARTAAALDAACRILAGSCKVDGRDAAPEQGGHHVLVGAVLAHALLAFGEAFPAMNRLFAYVVFFLALHRAGLHVSAHIPAVEALYLGQTANCRPVEAWWESGLVAECAGRTEWTGYLEETCAALVSSQIYMMTKLDGMARRRDRLEAILAADETMNRRQKEVLLEAILHSNAEFSYAVHEERHGVSYLCARSDFLRLLDLGFLEKCSDGVRHFFIAAPDVAQKATAYLARQCPVEYARYYRPDGTLRWEHRSGAPVAERLNSEVGFYERELVEGTYIEHQASRREPIALQDGPRSHVKIPATPPSGEEVAPEEN